VKSDVSPTLAGAIELAWVAAGHGAAVLAALGGVAILTRLLPPAAYGAFALALAVAILVGLIIFGPVAAAAGRLTLSAVERQEAGAFFQALRATFARRTLLVAAVACVGAPLVLAFARTTEIPLMIATAAFSIFSGATVIAESVLNAARHRRVVAIHKGLQQLLNYVGAALLVGFISDSAALAMAGFMFGALATMVSELIVLRRVFPGLRVPLLKSTAEPWRQDLLAFARPYERWGVFQWLQSTSDRWILAAIAGPREVGIYAVGYQLGYTPLGLLSLLIAQTIEPIIYARAGAGADAERLSAAERLRITAMAAFAALSAVVVTLVALFHETIFRLLLAEPYWSGSFLLPWLAAAAALFGLAQLQSVKWLVRLQPQRMLLPRVAGSLGGVALIAVGAHVAGALGVAIGHVVFSAIFLVWIAALGDSRGRERIDTPR
jgi:O-antigen/teichoic acid export membrane protein